MKIIPSVVIPANISLEINLLQIISVEIIKQMALWTMRANQMAINPNGTAKIEKEVLAQRIAIQSPIILTTLSDSQ
jgi:hypothetical protein